MVSRGRWPKPSTSHSAESDRRRRSLKRATPDAEEALEGARTRLLRIVDRVGQGEFPPQPTDEILCDFCAYSAVCRKDYVHD